MTLISSMEFAERCGISFRQLDYYSRRGALRPAIPARGSGSRRQFDDALVPAVRNADRIARAISNDPSSRPHHQLMALLIERYPYGRLELGDGIVLSWPVQENPDD